MNLAIALLLAAVSFAFIVYPFLRRKPLLSFSSPDEKQKELVTQRDVTFAMLKELEFDYQSGVLSKEDYRELEAIYKKKAIAFLKDLDEVINYDSVNDELEASVLQLRRKIKREPIKAEKLSIDDAQIKRFCPQCGAAANPADRFCARCGKALK